MKLIQLHNNSWIDAHDVDSIVPTRGGMNTAWNVIQMKSGNKIILPLKYDAVSWSDRKDRMPDASREAKELALLISRGG